MSRSSLKILFLKSLKFLIIFFAIDFFFGFISKEIFLNQETGKYARITYSINENQSDILILGSSRAHRHYNPDVLEKKLNKICYNAGVKGQKLLFNVALGSIILERYNPEVIILNIDHNWFYEYNEAYDRLSDLYPYYWEHRSILKPIFNLNSTLDFIDFKLLFSSFNNYSRN